MNRRRFLKYAGLTAGAAGALALGLDYLLFSTTPESPQLLTTSTASSRLTSTTSIELASTKSTLTREALRTSHPPPRILATADDFERIRQFIQSDARAAYFYSKTKERATDILKQPPHQYKLKAQSAGEIMWLGPVSDDILWRIWHLATVYRLEGEDRFADRAWQELEAAAEFPNWDPSEFLSTAMMTHAFAMAYDWIPWTEERRTILRDAMVEKGLKPALKCYQGGPAYGWWVRADHNWNQVCNGGIGTGAIALLDDLPDLSIQIVEYAAESLRLPMAQFAPDGGWHEGPHYWNYGSYYNCAFLASLANALGTDYGLSEAPGFSDTGLFPIYLSGPTGLLFNFADTGGKTTDSDLPLHAPQMFWLARRFRRPLYGWYPMNYSGDGWPIDLVWFDPNTTDPQAENLPLDKHFRGRVDVAAFRGAWNDINAVFVAFKAGDNQVNHAHLDIGSFVLDALGQRWALDLGAEDYNVAGYWEAEKEGRRWNYYRLRAEGHNTVVVNPSSLPDQSPESKAKIVRFQSKPERSYAIADLLAPYADDVLSFQRGIALTDRRSVTIQDEITTARPSEIWWFMHTKADVQLNDDQRTATLRQDSARLRCSIGSPPEAQFSVMDARPLPSSPNPSGQTRNIGVRKLAVHMSGLTRTTLNVVMAPLRAGEKPAQPPSVVSLADW